MAAAAAEAPPGPEEAHEIDERFEYDAPRFYDFDEGSPPGAPPADGWFDTDGPKGEFSACAGGLAMAAWVVEAGGQVQATAALAAHPPASAACPSG